MFPINAFRHWYCVFVLRPSGLLASTPRCELIYCDSMFWPCDFILDAIRKYLQYELEEKRSIRIDINETIAPHYQLLVTHPLLSCLAK